MDILTKEELTSHIKFSGCKENCKGGQHVARVCSYIVGELEDLDITVKCGSHRSQIKNRELVIDAIYLLYLAS